MSNQALCTIVEQQVGIETVLHYTCRDRNVLSIQSDLLGASAVGVRNLICITGDPPKLGNYPDATAVFDVDAIGLVNIVRNLNRGLDIGGNPIGTADGLRHRRRCQSRALPTSRKRSADSNTKWKLAPSTPSRSPSSIVSLLETFLKRIEHCRIPVFAGIWPLTSARNAEFMKNELRVSIPDDIIDRMSNASTAEHAREEGVAIAREMLMQVRPDRAGRSDQRSLRTLHRGRRRPRSTRLQPLRHRAIASRSRLLRRASG